MTGRPRILALFGGAALFGQERANIEVLATLKTRDCDVLCLVRDETWSIHIPPALDAHGLAWRKVPYIALPLRRRLWPSVFRNAVAFLHANWRFLQVIREFQPTHIHAFNQLYVLNFLLGLMLVRTPMIFRAGDEPTVHNWAWRLLWRFAVWRTSMFVANAKFVARSMRHNGVLGERIAIIYNAPPSRPWLQGEPWNPALPAGSRALCYIGQMAEHKGPHLLVDAFREVAAAYPDAHLLMAGRISDWEGDAWARALRDRVAQDTLIGNRVVFLGEFDDVPGLLASCELLVVPSVFPDPSPNVVMEAKQAGRPTIVFPEGGLPELIEHGVDGHICAQSTVTALASALRAYLDDPTMAARQGEAAKASCDRLGVPQFGEKWGSVYGERQMTSVPVTTSPAALNSQPMPGDPPHHMVSHDITG